MSDIGYVLSDCLFWDIKVNVNSSTLITGLQHCSSVAVEHPFTISYKSCLTKGNLISMVNNPLKQKGQQGL